MYISNANNSAKLTPHKYVEVSIGRVRRLGSVSFDVVIKLLLCSKTPDEMMRQTALNGTFSAVPVRQSAVRSHFNFNFNF